MLQVSRVAGGQIAAEGMLTAQELRWKSLSRADELGLYSEDERNR